MNETKLKPCPFCGNEHLVIRYEYCTNTFAICCSHCQGLFALNAAAIRDRDEDKLIKAWNRRAYENGDNIREQMRKEGICEEDIDLALSTIEKLKRRNRRVDNGTIH